MQSARRLAPGAELALADCQKKIVDPEFKLKEKALGLLPLNPESPFGNFPKQKGWSSSTNKSQVVAYLSQTVATPLVRFNERERKFLRRGGGNRVLWKADVASLDYQYFLPMFFDGIREKEDPYRFLAVQGVYDLLKGATQKILPVIPQLVIPIKKALNTRDSEIIATTLKILQTLVLSARWGSTRALLLTDLALLQLANQQKSKSGRPNLLWTEKEETLHIFEINGGPDAFINIKYMIPTYESCVVQ
ncbi:hypothetical protein BESB_071980 [Besnoitia besnoiti]|uniref:Uncharacterized protein n=1 Tax=Besnoitia besnoiti TaxID=94643 RepID=A0A2A9MDL1_BESBE|nr:uncharacterized protein BESB_071980 [Besnoitia besnoiti]PFH34046.1 hypothetical protein BESB_071980 [Besnoitia besnoiti]